MPCQNVITVRGRWLHCNFVAGSFYKTKLCSRFLMVFGRNFCEKKDKFEYLNTIFGKLGVTHELGWWLAEKLMVNFLFALNELFFAIYYDSGVMRRHVYSLTVFAGNQPLCTRQKFYLVSSPINHSWHQKTRDTGLPETKTEFLCVSSFWHNTGVWRTDEQTDRRICRSIYSACKANFAARCKIVPCLHF